MLNSFAWLLSETKIKFIKKVLEKKRMPTAVCPECDEEVYVDADSEQGDVVSCDECGADLEVVGLDPIELDLYEGGDDNDDDYEEESF
jgi:alpha-aminoadipate/glutamate carrier protein LysW